MHVNEIKCQNVTQVTQNPTVSMKMLSFLLVAYFIRITASKDLTALLYDIDFSEERSFDLKSLVLDYGLTYNFSIVLMKNDESIKWAELDLILMDGNILATLDPNPFILPSIVPFYHMLLVIPSIKQLSKAEFYLIPFDKLVLVIHLLSPVYFAAILRIAFRHTRFMDNLLKTTRIMLTGSVGRQSLNSRIRSFHFVMTFYSVIMGMAYTTFLGSFFTNSVDRTDFLYMCSDSREELLNIKDNSIKFIILETSKYFEHVLNLNMSFGYCLPSLFWYKNFGFQRTGKYVFRPVLANENVYGHYMRINKNSPHLERFNNYLLDMYSYGFMKYWSNQMIIRNYRSIIQSYLKAVDSVVNFEDLQFVLIVFSCSLLGGICLFVAEVLRGWFH